jgi:hypothetical protein
MFLRELQTHNRLLSALVIIFICGQLFVILIWGIVSTPFYNYGMYSEKISIQKNYNVFEVELNGKRLEGKDFSASEWDKILVPLQFYASIKSSNQLYKLQIRRLLNKMHVSVSEANFIQSCNYEQFENWYRSYLENVTSKKTETLAVTYRN